MKVLLLCFLVLGTLTLKAHGQSADTTVEPKAPLSEQKVSSPVVVTASRIHQRLDSVGRTVYVLYQRELKQMPVHSIAEALAYLPGVDVRQRGPMGAQADISIRGGGFEQTAILINGMRISDVQTAHNVLAMPFTVDDIDRIEVVMGGGTRGNGPGAMDGSVNIILKGGGETRIAAALTGGDFSYRGASVSGTLKTDQTTHGLSAEYIHHGDYRQSTDLDLKGLTYRLQSFINEANIQAFGSVLDKSYGAGLFYSPRFPIAWERTVTWIAGAGVTAPVDSLWNLDVRALYRAAGDEFLLKRTDTLLHIDTLVSRNRHTTHTATLVAALRGSTALGESSIAIEGGHDRIVSSNLNDHNRNRAGGSIEHMIKFADLLRLTAGANIMAYSDRSPGIGWGADLAHAYDGGRAYVTVNRSFRIPSYTELFYKDATSIGDSTLRLETALSLEVGWVHTLTSTVNTGISLFRRNQTDGIDYAFQGDNLPFKATNIQSTIINGIEANVSYVMMKDLPFTHVSLLRLSANLNDATFSSPVQTRYALSQLRWQGNVQASFELPLNMSAIFLVRMFERYSDHVLRSTGDLKLIVPVLHQSGVAPDLDLMAEVVNIWNTRYIETGFGTAPPRWLRIGITATYADN